jgi:hypothetical protein
VVLLLRHFWQRHRVGTDCSELHDLSLIGGGVLGDAFLRCLTFELRGP